MLFDDDLDYVDLTHRMRAGMPVWPTHPHYCQEVVESFDRGDVACNHALCMSEHTGTHFDAPLHFVPGGRSIADVPVERFFGRMVMIDARDTSPATGLGPEAIRDFEDRHGAIAPGDAVFFHFGWDRFWSDPEQGHRVLEDWPGLSRETSLLLVERRVRIVGSDCLSIDRFGSISPQLRRLMSKESYELVRDHIDKLQFGDAATTLEASQR